MRPRMPKARGYELTVGLIWHPPCAHPDLCGEPCTIGWEMLRRYADHFVSVTDEVAKRGMRILANPVGGDMPVVSGESGAVTTGLVAELMADESLVSIRDRIGLGAGSRVLCISTEGDTDRESYRRIVYGRR